MFFFSCSQVDVCRPSDIEALVTHLEVGNPVLLCPLVLIWVSWCSSIRAITHRSHVRSDNCCNDRLC